MSGTSLPVTSYLRNRLLTPAVHLSFTLLLWTGLAAIEYHLMIPLDGLATIYFVLSVLAFGPFALLFSNFVFHFAYKGEVLQHAELNEGDLPRVAVLYTTYNDIIPFCVEENEASIEYPVDFWFLSDSDDPEALACEQGYENWRHYHRTDGEHGKSGIHNDWLADYGSDYDYFITLDADSIMAPGNIRRLVEHAEHPGNQDIAVFQTMMHVHPQLATTKFAQIAGRGVKWGTRITPIVSKLVYRQNTYWGSNGLLRVKAVRNAGGFDVDYLCDDFVLTVRLDQAGWRTEVIDDYSYEGFPTDLHALRVRTIRWVTVNRDMARTLFAPRLSAGTRLSCLTPLAFYGVTPVLLTLVILPTIFNPEVLAASSTATMGFGFVVFLFIFCHRIVSVESGDFREFVSTATLETLAVLGMSLRVTAALFFGGIEWTPSRKESTSFSWAESFREMVPEVSFGGFLIAIMVIQGLSIASIGLVGVWAASFLAGPLILATTSNEAE